MGSSRFIKLFYKTTTFKWSQEWLSHTDSTVNENVFKITNELATLSLRQSPDTVLFYDTFDSLRIQTVAFGSAHHVFFKDHLVKTSDHIVIFSFSVSTTSETNTTNK